MGGPSLGPFISAWLVTVISWRATYGVLAGLHGLSTLIVIFFGKETLYDRKDPQLREMGSRGRIKLLLGIAGFQAKARPSIWEVIRHLVDIQLKPQIFFISTIYVMMVVMWVTGVTTTITEILTPPPYSFNQQAIALSFLGPLIGSVIGQIWGHWFLDWLQAQYVRKHNGIYVLENRLWGAWPASIIAFACLILYGQALQHSLHWSAPIIAWSGLTLAMIVGNAAISAYCLDSFPMHSCIVAGIVNMWRLVSARSSLPRADLSLIAFRTVGGFCVNYFQLPWIEKSGPATSFGLQAMIFGVAFIGSVGVTQMFGRKWRMKYQPPKAEN